jgi:hypothetical protein
MLSAPGAPRCCINAGGNLGLKKPGNPKSAVTAALMRLKIWCPLAIVCALIVPAAFLLRPIELGNKMGRA